MWCFQRILVSKLRMPPMLTSYSFTAGRSIAKQITHGQTIYIMNPVYKWLGVQIQGAHKDDNYRKYGNSYFYNIAYPIDKSGSLYTKCWDK